jgi:hypothetical protein
MPLTSVCACAAVMPPAALLSTTVAVEPVMLTL